MTPEDLPTTIDKEISSLEDTKRENLQYTNKSQYIKSKVFQFGTTWWDKWEAMMNSGDKDLEKTAMMEYNKLQSKILPTEISGADGKDLPTSIIITLNKNAADTNTNADAETGAGTDEIGGQDN